MRSDCHIYLETHTQSLQYTYTPTDKGAYIFMKSD